MKNIALLLVLCILVTSCGSSSDGQTNYPVSLNLSGYTVSSSLPFPLNKIIGEAYAAVSEMRVCFKRLRFKKDIPQDQQESELVEDNIDIDLGEVILDSSGGSLANIIVPADRYIRIEVDLERDCDGTTKNSVNLVNDFGTYTSTDRITIKFEGEFVVDEQESFTLNIQNILDAANNYDMSSGSLKEALEGASGSIM